MEKEQLRHPLLEKRRKLSSQERKEKSRLACAYVLSSPFFLEARSILFYAAQGGELELDPAIQAALAQEKEVLFPRVTPPGMTLHRISTYPQDLEPGYGGILEPLSSLPTVAPEKVDLAFIPGVGFDVRGNRLGRGQGHYDRFLSQIPGKKVGMCYQFQVLPSLPVEAHDLPLDVLITEHGVISP